MEEQITPTTSADQFGMTEEDMKRYKYKNLLGRINYYFSLVAPTLIKILNSFLYYTIKFLKAFVGSLLRMAFKGE